MQKLTSVTLSLSVVVLLTTPGTWGGAFDTLNLDCEYLLRVHLDKWPEVPIPVQCLVQDDSTPVPVDEQSAFARWEETGNDPHRPTDRGWFSSLISSWGRDRVPAWVLVFFEPRRGPSR